MSLLWVEVFEDDFCGEIGSVPIVEAGVAPGIGSA